MFSIDFKKRINPKNYLLMRVPLRAKLTCSIRDVKEILENHPDLVLIKNSPELRYTTLEDEIDHFYTFEFGKEHIIAEVYSKESPIYLMREILLRLLSLLAILGDSYKVDIESIFPYIAIELSSNQISSYINNIEQPRKQNESDIILAKRILELNNKNRALSEELEKYKNQTTVLLSYLIIQIGMQKSLDLKEIEKKYNVNKEHVDSAIICIQNFGYKTVNLGANKINVVKA